jgi:hypothetical protein
MPALPQVMLKVDALTFQPVVLPAQLPVQRAEQGLMAARGEYRHPPGHIPVK